MMHYTNLLVHSGMVSVKNFVSLSSSGPVIFGKVVVAESLSIRQIAHIPF